MKRLFFHACVAWLVTFALIQRGTAQQTRSQHSFSNSNGSTYLYVDDDSSTNPVQTMIVYKDGPLYNIVMAGDKVLSMTVNGRQVPADSLPVYDPLIRKLTAQIKVDREQAKRDRQQAERDRDMAARDREQAARDREQAVHDREQAVHDKLQAEHDQLQAMQDKRQAELEHTKLLQDKLQSEREHEQSAREHEQAMLEKMQAERDLSQVKRDHERMELDRVQADRDRQQAVLDRVQAERDRQLAEEDRAKLKILIKEAINDGLVRSEKEVRSVFLDEDNFILNGKVQSEELHKKYSSMFLRSGGQISFRHNQ